LSTDVGKLSPPDPRLHGTPPKPMPPVSEGPNPREGQKVPASVNKGAVTHNGKVKA
jgi:hypothetical protein